MKKFFIFIVIPFLLLFGGVASYALFWETDIETIGEGDENTEKISKLLKGANLSNETIISLIDEYKLSDIIDLYSVEIIAYSGDKLFIADKKQGLISLNLTTKESVKIGTFGQGPGEYSEVSAMEVFKNKLYVVDRYQKRANRYSLSGEFIDEIKLEKVPMKLTSYKDSLLIGYSLSQKIENLKMYFAAPICSFDEDLNILKEIYGKMHPLDMNKGLDFTNLFCKFTIANGLLYIGDISDIKMKILEFSLNDFELLKSYEKNIRKIKYSKQEKNKMGPSSRMRNSDKTQKFNGEFKKSITDLFPLNNSLLIVSPNSNGNQDFYYLKENELMSLDNPLFSYENFNKMIFSRNLILKDDKLLFVVNNDEGYVLKEFLTL